jgi:hypothetical protein
VAARGVTVENQFGSLVVDLVHADLLMVPSAKSDVGPPEPLGTPTIDHFKCYKVKRARFRTTGFTVDD